MDKLKKLMLYVVLTFCAGVYAINLHNMVKHIDKLFDEE